MPLYPGAPIGTQSQLGSTSVDTQATVEEPLFGLESRPEEPNEQGIMSALDLQMKDKDCVGGYVERDLSMFTVSWTGPKATMESNEEKVSFLGGLGLKMRSESRRVAFERFIHRRKHTPSEDIIIEETFNLSPTFWSHLLLLDTEQQSQDKSKLEAEEAANEIKLPPSAPKSPPATHFLNALNLIPTPDNKKLDTEVKWRTVLKDRARRYNLKVPDQRRRLKSPDRSSEEFDETLLKKARFDPKSFAQEFHESVLKDTREKLGFMKPRGSPEALFSNYSLNPSERYTETVTTAPIRSADIRVVEDRGRRPHPAFSVHFLDLTETSPRADSPLSGDGPRSPLTPQTPPPAGINEWPGVEALLALYHRHYELRNKERSYLREKMQALAGRKEQLENDLEQVKAQMQQLENECRAEADASEKKQLQAHKLLKMLSGLRQEVNRSSVRSSGRNSYIISDSVTANTFTSPAELSEPEGQLSNGHL
ncbi:hypothetical protein BIW11_08861 [Tropilaelaps mercedesae]|uniref:Genetic suppressor element 1-like n=1 Tax=Tropilaelaps mercedesae TaxID=418985 RepID=A0A1V9XMS7_9ACAR|nr:hypothetical protein BIW11_08861 [Tropilaelaps mercedesae]